MENKFIYVMGVILGVVFVTFIIFLGVNGQGSLEKYGEKTTIYKTSTCGCCEVYTSYFKSKGSSDVSVVTIQDNEKFMKEHGIPMSLESCHTTLVGNYFVEGHVPVEAIQKLLSEKPDIAGIGMPGMPNGAPGMPGVKSGDFVISGVNHDGSTYEFMRI